MIINRIAHVSMVAALPWFSPDLTAAKQEPDFAEKGWQCLLEIEGALVGTFDECSGLGTENEIIEHKAVNPQGIELILKIPGSLHFDDIVLKRGLTTDRFLWNWRQAIADGDFANSRKNGSIVISDQSGGEIARWNFNSAWPSHVEISEDGVENAILVSKDTERVN